MFQRNAASTYNILNEEGRFVAAALLPYGASSWYFIIWLTRSLAISGFCFWYLLWLVTEFWCYVVVLMQNHCQQQMHKFFWKRSFLSHFLLLFLMIACTYFEFFVFVGKHFSTKKYNSFNEAIVYIETNQGHVIVWTCMVFCIYLMCCVQNQSVVYFRRRYMSTCMGIRAYHTYDIPGGNTDKIST